MPSIKFWVHPSNQTAGGSMKFETLRIFFGGSVAKFHLAKFHQSWPELKGIAALCNGLVSWMPFSWERWRQENACQKLSWHIGLSQSVCQSSRKGLPSCQMQVRWWEMLHIRFIFFTRMPRALWVPKTIPYLLCFFFWDGGFLLHAENPYNSGHPTPPDLGPALPFLQPKPGLAVGKRCHRSNVCYLWSSNGLA